MLHMHAGGLIQTSHEQDTAAFFETLFSLSNGTLGLRATVDADGEGAIPGLFMAGVYAPGLTVPHEIVNLPNWLPLSCRASGREARELDGARLSGFRRVLDYRRGLLTTRARIDVGDGLAVRLVQTCLVHAARPGLGLVFGTLRAETGGGPVWLESAIDNRHGNRYGGGHTPSTRLHHCRIVQASAGHDEGLAMRIQTRGTDIAVDLRSRLIVSTQGEWRGIRRRDEVAESIRVALVPGVPVSFFRPAVTGRDGGAAALLADAVTRGPRELVREHTDVWRDRWRRTETRIAGDRAADARLQFSRFHLLQAMPGAGDDVNIAARGLTSEYHSGHFFFNTELFKLPYFLLTEPDRARALLRFRTARLDAARRHAREDGLEGARFPEESDDRGEPASPWRVDDIYSGEHVFEWSGKETKFISACVAMGAHWYGIAADDAEFLCGDGLELLIETARFGASLLQWDDAQDAYVINNVMCADEYHYHVANNAFTNAAIRFNLECASEAVETALARLPREAAARLDRLRHTPQERAAWRLRASRLRPPRFFGGVLEQFDGYAELPDACLDAFDLAGRPVMKAADAEAAAKLKPFENRIIKEADVILLHDVLPGRFDAAQHKRDFDFYEPRTTMESSLSAAPYGVVAARLGEAEAAYRLFMLSAGYNLDYRPRENYGNGIHLAAGAGAWRILVQGFLGQTFTDACLDLTPRPLPKRFGAIVVRLVWRSAALRLRLERQCLSLHHLGTGPAIDVRVHDGRGSAPVRSLEPGQDLHVPLADGEG